VLYSTDYTAGDGNKIVLVNEASDGDEVTLIAYGGVITPYSVIMAVTSSGGVISNAGFRTFTSDTVITSLPITVLTSSGLRSSMGITGPARLRSKLDEGAAT
jgi:3,4-dihydroxy-2-butanone 4-phosphate synthase